MAEKPKFTCRHCGRPIVVPGAYCPWCDERIMIICANCKQYADDSKEICEHCREPLREHDRSEFTKFLRVDEGVAGLAADRERAKLVPSAVIVRSVPEFFFDDGRRRTVFVDLFGSPHTPRRAAAAVLFSALAYVIENGYCEMLPVDEERIGWVELKPWNGQRRCLEAMLVAQAEERAIVTQIDYDFTLNNALDEVIREAMGFRYEVPSKPLVRLPGAPQTPQVVDASAKTAVNGILETSRQVVLPDHDLKQANAEVYQSVLGFVRKSPQDVRLLIETIKKVFEWFFEYEEDPSIVLLKRG